MSGDQLERRGPRYELCRHARQRKAQRAVADLQIELVRLFGVDHYQKGGATLSWIPERVITQLRAALDKSSGMAIVKGEDDCIVTVLHRDRKIRTPELAA